MRIDRPDDADGREEPHLPRLPGLSGLRASRETPVEAHAYEAAAGRRDAGQAGRGGPDIEPDAGNRVARALDNRAKVDAAVRAYAIDQGYERVSEIEKENSPASVAAALPPQMVWKRSKKIGRASCRERVWTVV